MGVSKKLRFEVFKRDSFTCQYCGRQAPDVVLHCDHVQPQVAGGDDDILNLVTSCQDCNLGKGPRPLSDTSVMMVKRRQLAELQERREQLEMMLEWQKEITGLELTKVDLFDGFLEDLTGWHMTEYGKQQALRLLEEFGFEEVCAAARIGWRQYNQDDQKERWETMFSKLGGICYNRRKGGLA